MMLTAAVCSLRWRLIGGFGAGLGLALAFGLAHGAPDDEGAVQRMNQGRQSTRAFESADASLGTRVGDRDARFSEGVALANQGRVADALKVFRELAIDFPGSAEVYNNLAVLQAENGETARAVASLETALRIDPSYAKAYENLGDLQASLAEQAYARAHQLIPASSDLESKLELLRRVRAPAPATTQTGKSSERPGRDAVIQALLIWADAWSRRDMDAYFASYVPAFAPQGLTHGQWREQRQKRVARRTNIDVRLSDFQIDVRGETAEASFQQVYRSDAFRNEGPKRVKLIRAGADRWLISEELEVRPR